MIPTSTRSREEDITALGADGEDILWPIKNWTTGAVILSSEIECDWVDIIVHKA